ncbi:hypothetical protein U6A24_21580 [Aquimarina gracilis]|uniref:Lipoprotein n=1 Tax=Aquimarina gracilis TaxID=874422 RepID=A0ABU6A1W9_9FLAO|nr:hypothetical protein [Aquimarina gracilis]MEB3348082.1 hypothetical protein [Aquimarina gracilis]
MKNCIGLLKRLGLTVLVISTFTSCEVDNEESNFNNQEFELDQKSIIGKEIYKTIKEYRKNGNIETLKNYLLDIKELQANRQADLVINDYIIDIYKTFLTNFNNRSFEEHMTLSNSLKTKISNTSELTNTQKEFLITELSDFEWLKYSIENDESQLILNKENPEPGLTETSGNYIDRCMEAYINENFTWANPIDRISTVLAGPAGLGWAFLSCEYTFYDYDKK